MSPNLALIVPFSAAGLAALIALVADGLGRYRIGALVSSVLLLAASVAAGAAALTTGPEPVWQSFMVGAGYSGAMCVVYLLAAASNFALSDHIEASQGALSALIALSAMAAAALAGALDRVMILILLEALAVLGYAIVSSARTPEAAEAAMKFFVQGTIATAVYLLAMAARLAAGAPLTGTAALSAEVTSTAVAVVSSALVLVAFSFKLGAFPFHSWAPDAYDTAPPEGAAFLSSAVKVAAFAALFGLLTSVVEPTGTSGQVRFLVASVAAGSVIFGNLAALAQQRYGRMLAFSGIAQVGYGLIAVATGNGRALLLFAVCYAVAVSGAFLTADAVRARRPAWEGTIAGLAGLAREAPLLSASLSVFLLSMTGIPPLLGFWGKFLVFLNAAPTDLLWLVIVGVLGSVVSFGYYGRVIRVMYFDPNEATTVGHSTQPAGDEDSGAQRHARTEAVVVILAALVILAGVYLLVFGLATAIGGGQSYGVLQLLPFAQ